MTEQWAALSLDPEDRLKWTELTVQDKVRYAKEQEEWDHVEPSSTGYHS